MSTLERSVDDDASARPTWWRALVLRLGFLYWLLFCIPVIATQIYGLDWLGSAAVTPACDAIVQWVGAHVLGLTDPLSIGDNGSGDRAGYWVLLLCTAAASLVGAVVWTVVDRRRAHDAQLRAFLRVYIRYTLAFAMLVFGILKLFILQFPAPTTGRLLQRYGDSSPMGLLWTFMGASPAYVFFSGAAETLGAMLLLFRRTTTLGALVLIAVLTNVVLMNFCYDVPVKIHSTHYLVMCVVLLLPDLGRLASVLVLDRAVPPRRPEPVLPPRARRIRRIAKWVAITALLALNLRQVLEQRVSVRGFTQPSTWYDGTWNVTAFARDGVDVPPLVNDPTRWRRLVLQTSTGKSYLRWRLMDDARGPLHTLVVDDAARTMTATPDGDAAKAPPLVLRYTRTDADHLLLEGALGSSPITVTLERFDPSSMLLLSRGFHWVNEVPFNR